MTVWTIPNLLTFARLLLAPFVAWQLLVLQYEAAFWLFAIAASTDLLDGVLARLLDQRSEFGVWLDPIADKTMLLTTLLLLTWDALLPLWFAALVLTRDAIVLGGAAAYRRLTGGLQVAPTWLGKSAIFLEFILVGIALAEAAFHFGMGSSLPWLVAATAAVAAVSGVQYVRLWMGKTRSFLKAVRS